MVAHVGGEQSSYIGPTDLMFPRMVYVVSGERFVAAAPVKDLCLLYKKLNQKDANNFLDLVDFLQGLTTKYLSAANGIWAKLVAGDCMVIPPGWFMCESFMDALGDTFDILDIYRLFVIPISSFQVSTSSFKLKLGLT